MKEREEKPMDKKQTFAAVYYLAKAHALCCPLIFTRKNFGRQALSPAIASLGMMLLVGTFGHTPQMFIFTLVWLVALGIQRSMSVTAASRGLVRHSYWFGDIDVKATKNAGLTKWVLEPFCGVVAWAAFKEIGCPPAMCNFLGAAGLSCLIVAAIEEQRDRMTMTAMRDGQIEQSYWGERMRSERIA